MDTAPPPEGLPLHEAARAADDALARGHPAEVAMALELLGRCYRAAGETDAAEATLEQALRWSRLCGGADPSADLLCQLCALAADRAEADDDGDRSSGRGHAARETARTHAREACLLAARVADRQWEIRVLLRVSEVLDRIGDRDHAAALQTRALRLMRGRAGQRVDLAAAPARQA